MPAPTGGTSRSSVRSRRRWGGTASHPEVTLTASDQPHTAALDHRTRAPINAGVAILASSLLPFGLVGELAALLALPLWLTSARNFRGARALQVLLLLCTAAGLVLWVWNPADGSFRQSGIIANSLLPIHALVALSSLLWARTIIGVRAVALAYGLGALAHAILSNPYTGQAVDLKYHYAWPLALIALALWDREKPAFFIAGLASLAGIAAVSDYRGLLAFTAICLLLRIIRPLVMGILGRPETGKPLKVGAILALATTAAAAGAGVYLGIERALMSGLLGREVQAKTADQVQNYGSLLAGGRTEPPMTWNLMLHNPPGYGPGYIPTSVDYQAGVYAQVQQSSLSYVRDYTFGEQLKLHSFWGDLWVNFGIVGAATALAMALTLAVSLMQVMHHGKHFLLLSILCVWGIWHVAFSPIYSNLQDVALMLALTLTPLSFGGHASRRVHAGAAASYCPLRLPQATP